MKVGDLWKVEFERGLSYSYENGGILECAPSPEIVHIHRIEELRDWGENTIHVRTFGWSTNPENYGYRRGITQASKERLLRYMAKHYRIENR